MVDWRYEVDFLTLSLISALSFLDFFPPSSILPPFSHSDHGLEYRPVPTPGSYHPSHIEHRASSPMMSGVPTYMTRCDGMRYLIAALYL